MYLVVGRQIMRKWPFLMAYLCNVITEKNHGSQ